VTVLVTGLIEGFVGPHLSDLLRQNGEEPVPLKSDLRDSDALSDEIKRTKPDRVYHLAAISSISQSWKDPELVFDVNTRGTRFLLDAILESSPECRVLFVSSGSVYGPPIEGKPFSEDDVPCPSNPYSVSKLAAEIQCKMFHEKHSLDVRIVRPQGHTGPGQLKGAVVPDFASQIAEIATNKRPPQMSVGNLESAREFADVRDVVRAYHTVMEKGEAGATYNLANNYPRTIGDVLMTLSRIAGVTAEVKQDPDKLRPVDESSPRLDTSRIQSLGFSYKIPFEKTMADVLEEWMERARRK